MEAVKAKVPAAKESVRLFLAPGVLHCGGGAGPDRFDTLAAMEHWIEHDAPPTDLLATKANSPISRPLCLYPYVAKYTGSGDTNKAENFACAAP
jgi:feruloyl esterase